MKVKLLSRVLTLSDPMDCGLPGSSIHGIFRETVLEWGAIAFSGDKTIRYEMFPRDLSAQFPHFTLATTETQQVT